MRLDGVGVKVFTRQHFRKSSQWVALVRGHAELVARERELLWEGAYMWPDGRQYILRRRCALEGEGHVWPLAWARHQDKG